MFHKKIPMLALSTVLLLMMTTIMPVPAPLIPLIADANGPYQGYEGTPITFDASGSGNSEPIALYEWDFNMDTVIDYTGPSPTVDHTYGDDFIGQAWLRVTENMYGSSAEDLADVTVYNVDPSVDAGPDQEFYVEYPYTEVCFTGSFTDPGWLDTHTAEWDFGDGSPPVAGVVVEENVEPDSTGTVDGVCHKYTPPDPVPPYPIFVVTLTVEDDEGGEGSDTMTVTLLERPEIPVYVDIKPGSYPNPINKKIKGVLPVAILGTEDFDVTTIDPTTVEISLEGIVEGVSPLRWNLEDVNGDGILDMALKFKTQEVVSTLTITNDPPGEVDLTISGKLKREFSGTRFAGQDEVLILGKNG